MRGLLALLALAVVWGTAQNAAAIDPIYTGFFSGAAVGGYDPVAYFTVGKPVEGSSEYTHEWMGATWYFTSAQNRASFEKEPEKYAPQYGGYCAYAVANGATAPGDPQVWKIVDGKLFLNVTKSIQTEWAKDIAGYVEKADANWPRLLADK